MGGQRGTGNRSDRCVTCQCDTIALLLLLLGLLLLLLLITLLLDLSKTSR